MVKQTIRDSIAKLLARMLRHFAFDPRYFELWQAHGYHVTLVHFYSPLADTRNLTPADFTRRSELPGIEISGEAQLALLEKFRTASAGEYQALPSSPPTDRKQFYLGNGSFEAVDAEVLWCMIRHFKPQRFIEIGSGFSTLLAAQAISRNAAEGFPCALTAIEPYPPDFLHQALSHPVELVVQPVQKVPLATFETLGAGDILFIDSTHVCKIGSDVQFEFLEVLPRLAAGVLVHVHDIFLPREYPASWVEREHRFWNEQYLMQAFLCGNRDFEVIWAGAWMHTYQSGKLAEAFPSYDPGTKWPASFWLRRRHNA